MRLYLLLLSCLIQWNFVAYGEMPPSPPAFSWDTIPLFIHSGNRSGPLNETAAKYMSTFPIATIAHNQGGPNGDIEYCDISKPSMVCEEDAILTSLKQIRSYNNDTRTLFYLNTLMNFPWYNLSNSFLGENEKYLLHYNGKLIHYSDCDKKHSNMNYTMFDHSQNETRNLWLNTIKYALSHEWVDGAFTDRGRAQLQNDVGCYNWTQKQITDWNNGHKLAIQGAMDIVKNQRPNRGLVVPNNANIDGVNGRFWENFRQDDTNGVPTGDDLEILMGDKGVRIAEVHKDGCNSINKSMNNNYNQTLTAYLIGAYDHSYYGCTNGFYLQGDWDRIWQNEDYHKPLMDAIFDNKTQIYFRNFTKGVNVWLDYKWSKPCIKWSDGSITGNGKDCDEYAKL